MQDVEKFSIEQFLEVYMIKILLVINTLVIIIALVFWVIGIITFKNNENNIKGIRYILIGTNVTGICTVLTAALI